MPRLAETIQCFTQKSNVCLWGGLQSCKVHQSFSLSELLFCDISLIQDMGGDCRWVRSQWCITQPHTFLSRTLKTGMQQQPSWVEQYTVITQSGKIYLPMPWPAWENFMQFKFSHYFLEYGHLHMLSSCAGWKCYAMISVFTSRIIFHRRFLATICGLPMNPLLKTGERFVCFLAQERKMLITLFLRYVGLLHHHTSAEHQKRGQMSLISSW